MTVNDSKLSQLNEYNELALKGGGEAATARHQSQGKSTARERIKEQTR